MACKRERVRSPSPPPKLTSGAWPRSVCLASGVARKRHLAFGRGQLLIDDLQRSFHRDGTQAADPFVERIVEELQSNSIETITAITEPMSRAWTTARSPLSA